LVAELEGYSDIFWKKYYAMMGRKLGLDEINSDNVSLITQLEKMLSFIKPDMTIFYQRLMELPQEEKDVASHFADSFYQELTKEQEDALSAFINAYTERTQKNNCSREVSLKRMEEANPRFILRNYLLHQAIEELEKGENTLFLKLQEAMKEPYSKKWDEFLIKRPDWAGQKAGCSMLSCSS